MPRFSTDPWNKFRSIGPIQYQIITYGGPLNLPGVKLAYSSEQGNVYELENVLPKAFFVDSIQVIPDGPSAFEYLKNPGRIDFSTQLW